MPRSSFEKPGSSRYFFFFFFFLKKKKKKKKKTVYRWKSCCCWRGSQAIAYIDRVNFAVVGPHLIKVLRLHFRLKSAFFSPAFNWAFTFSLLAAGSAGR